MASDSIDCQDEVDRLGIQPFGLHRHHTSGTIRDIVTAKGIRQSIGIWDRMFACARRFGACSELVRSDSFRSSVVVSVGVRLFYMAVQWQRPTCPDSGNHWAGSLGRQLSYL